MVGAKSAVECSFRILSCSVLGHMFFYFVVLVYVTINFSLLNLVLILLIILDVLSLQNIQKYALSISSLPSRPRRRSVFCSRQDEEEQYRISRSDTRSSGSTLLTNAPNNEVHVSLNEDAHFSFWAALLPNITIRYAIYWWFVLFLLLKLIFINVGNRWWEQSPEWARILIYMINGGLNQYPNVLFEYGVLLFVSLSCNVGFMSFDEV